METEILNHESALQIPISGGDEFTQQGHLGSEKIQERFQDVNDMWTHLIGLMGDRKKRLIDALSLYKVFTKADGVEQWIIEKEKMLRRMVPDRILRIVR